MFAGGRPEMQKSDIEETMVALFGPSAVREAVSLHWQARLAGRNEAALALICVAVHLCKRSAHPAGHV